MKKDIRVLDCTLRDGGYVNDWRFGEECISAVKGALEESGVDFIEMGLVQDVSYDTDRTIFDNLQRVHQMIDKWGGVRDDARIYGVLIEMSNHYPQERLMERAHGDIKVLRYSFWKRLMDEAIQYAKKISEKGYKVCLQPTRAEQYTEKEFAKMCRAMSELKPYGLYIVDTFGLLHEEDVIRYAQIAHDNLDPEVVLGYHAHDNMSQAFCNACAFLEQNYDERIIQIDGSIFGMGRGAGNLKLEQILEYLNRTHGKNYQLSPIYRVWDMHLSKFMQESPWRNDLAYFIAAKNRCNPNYASYYLRKNLGASEIEKILNGISDVDKYLYDDDKAETFIRDIVGKNIYR